MTFKIVIPFLIYAGAAASQALTGTIVVVFYSPAEAVFAADSRTTVVGADYSSDDECKLLVLNGNIIAAFGGTTGSSVRNGQNGAPVFYDAAQKFAREEASKLRRDKGDTIGALASAWTERMREFDAQSIAMDSKVEEPPYNNKEEGEAYSWAIFASTNPDGQLVVVDGVVYWSTHSSSLVTKVSAPYNSDNPISQFIANDTPQSDPIFQRLKAKNLPSSYHPEWKDRDAAKAVYLAEQTRDQAHDERIGGKIDAVELRRGASNARWIQLKEGCPSN